MRGCDRMGRVQEGAPVILGSTAIESGDDVIANLNTIFGAKFRLEYGIFTVVERLGKQGRKDRVLLGITPALQMKRIFQSSRATDAPPLYLGLGEKRVFCPLHEVDCW